MTSRQAPRAPFWSEPYRPFFLLGALYAGGLLPLWGWHLLWVAGLSGEVAVVSPALGFAEHAHLMIWGLLGCYVFGFSLTAYPKQNGGEPLGPKRLQGLFFVFLLAQAALLLGWAGGVGGALLAGKLGELAAYGALLIFLTPIGLRSLRRQFAWQPLAVLLGLATGACALAVQALAPPELAWPALQVALWAYLAPLLASFAYRLIPFFSSRVIPEYRIERGRWFLPLLMVLLWARLLGRMVALSGPLLAAIDGALFVWMLAEWLRWRPWRALGVPLIGALHLAWLWLLGALAVGALRALDLSGLRETHLLSVGCLLTFALAISTRVTLGHGGRPLRMGSFGVAVIALAQLAALIRVFGPSCQPEAPALLVPAVSAFVMAGAFLLWLARFGAYLIAPPIPPEKACPK